MNTFYPFDLLVVFTQPPLAASLPKEGLDLALVSSTFEQRTGLIFLGESVLQLSQKQQPNILDLKGTQAMLKALGLYDIDQIYVEEQAMLDYGLANTDLLVVAKKASQLQLKKLITTSRNLLTF